MKNIQKDILDKITPEIKKEMESIWFSADLHHAHTKIVDICNRPIDINEKLLIDIKTRNTGDPEYRKIVNITHNNWLVKDVINKYVKKNDTLYLLGDVSMAKRKDAERFIDRLNGNKFLVIGNHDKNIKNSTRFFGIDSIKDFTFSRKNEGINIHIVLCHYPMSSWNRRIHGAWQLYGHVHGRNKNMGRSLDVGIDNAEIGFRPINLYEVCQIMAKKPQYSDFDEVINNYESTSPLAGTNID